MKKLIIVGAGISGLTAGIYALRSGMDVTIYEQHKIPGGFCTAWRRKGYRFDGAMHWLTGSSPKTAIHELWRDVGALNEDVKVLLRDPFLSTEWEGITLHLYRDLNRLRTHLTEIAPQDTKEIDTLCADIRAFCGMSMPVLDESSVKVARKRRVGLGMLGKMLPAMMRMKRLGKTDCNGYIEKFTHQGIRMLLSCVVPMEYNAAALVATLATLANGDGGFPEGGSLPMIQRMAQRFVSLGGQLELDTQVEQVLVENGKTTGVRIKGQKHAADAVIVTQELIAAVDKLFAKPPNDAWINEMRRDLRPAVCTYIGIGVKVNLAGFPPTLVFRPQRPFESGGFSYDVLAFNNYAQHPGFAPAGGTALTTALMGDSYHFWLDARAKGTYEQEKEALGVRVTEALIAQYPALRDQIEVVDVATPLTYERYTGAYHGSWMSIWAPRQKQLQCPARTAEAKGVFFAGHRMTTPGGMPVALVSGRRAAQLVCGYLDLVFEGKERRVQ